MMSLIASFNNTILNNVKFLKIIVLINAIKQIEVKAFRV